jgi:hypothetical protein
MFDGWKGDGKNSYVPLRTVGGYLSHEVRPKLFILIRLWRGRRARTRDLCRDSYANWLYLNDFMGVDG